MPIRPARPLLGALFAAGLLTPLPAPAGEAAVEDEDRAGDIVVTARRRAESLLEVPISLTAFSGETLAARGTPDITALQFQTPNTTLQVARGSNSTLIAFIRGVGQQDPLWGFEPGVGLYVDDVYIARPQGAVLDIFDVERIEILRGPQGTLYGRNTIGGAVKYVTRRLGQELSGRLSASYGSYDQIDVTATLSVPLGAGLSVGGGLASYNRDGFGRNLTSGAAHYNRDVIAGRLSAELEQGPLFLRLAGDRTEDRSNPRHGHRQLGFLGLPAFAPPANPYDTRAGIGDRNKVVTQGLSLTAELDLAGSLALKSITAYRDGRTDTVIDFDNTPGPVLDVPAFYDDWQFTQEVQLLVAQPRFQAVFGAFYLKGRAAGAFDTVLGNANLTILTSGTVRTDSVALFGDVSIDLAPELKISGGLRWTRDDKEGTVFRRNFTGIRSPQFGNPNAIPGLIRTNYTNARAFEKVTPRAAISWQPTRDLNLYASYGKGFKSGGFDMRGDAVFTPFTVNGYEPETIDSFEVGFKGAFLGRRLFVSAAAFYSDYRDVQVTVQAPVAPPGVGIASVVDNAGKAEIQGFELELAARPTDDLTLTAALGHTDATFKEFLTFIAGGTQPVDVAGQRVFQNTPEWVAHVSATWGLDVAGGRLSLTPSLALRDRTSQFEIPNADLDQPSFVLVDASAVWESADRRWSVGIHGRNLTDALYKIGGYNFPGALFGNSVVAFYGPPRTVTATVGLRLGAARSPAR